MASDESRPPSIQIVEAVAELEGVAPEELTQTLGEALDPDALDTILRSHEGDIEIEFTFADHSVLVTDSRIYIDGVVAIDRA